MESSSSRLFVCARCNCLTQICRRCDHGQIYCSKACSSLARTLHHRDADRRYQQSRQGRFTHAARSRRYRLRLKERQKVTDQGSAPKASDVPLAVDSMGPLLSVVEVTRIELRPTRGLCAVCRTPLGSWVRQGFLRSGHRYRLDRGSGLHDDRRRHRRKD